MHPAPNSSPKTPENAAADDALAELRARAGEANINEKMLLATDYLNHFNEFVMVLDLIPNMPDCLEDAEAWQPKHYQDHFRDSAFSAKELAIMAYDHSPAEYRDQFETLVDLINTPIPKKGWNVLDRRLTKETSTGLGLNAPTLLNRFRNSWIWSVQ